MNSRIVLALILAVFFSSAVAGDYNAWFDKVDADGDGYLSAAELGEKKAYKIDKMDTDGDNLISRDELMQYKAAKKHKKDRA
ncbi:MAG: hypothetical protein HKN49_03130 [Gammaproteobacteria bacterium]|nr:hypothetical protein [Gammaproteobacteria bacterium]